MKLSPMTDKVILIVQILFFFAVYSLFDIMYEYMHIQENVLTIFEVVRVVVSLHKSGVVKKSKLVKLLVYKNWV